MGKYTPKQGDLIYITLDPTRGREMRKRRPAIVISSTDFNIVTPYIAVCPITSTENTQPGFVELNEDHLIYGHIDTRQFRTIDPKDEKRNIRFIEKATARELGMTLQYVAQALTLHFESE